MLKNNINNILDLLHTQQVLVRVWVGFAQDWDGYGGSSLGSLAGPTDRFGHGSGLLCRLHAGLADLGYVSLTPMQGLNG